MIEATLGTVAQVAIVIPPFTPKTTATATVNPGIQGQVGINQTFSATVGTTKQITATTSIPVGGGTPYPVSPYFTATLTDFASSGYYYYGGVKSDGSWQINRFTKGVDLAKTVALQASNSSYTTLAAAWANREVLTYA